MFIAERAGSLDHVGLQLEDKVCVFLVYGSARTGGGDAAGLPVRSRYCVAACERLLEQTTEKLRLQTAVGGVGCDGGAAEAGCAVEAQSELCVNASARLKFMN